MDDIFKIYGILFVVAVLVVWAVVRKLPKSNTTTKPTAPLEPMVHRGTLTRET